MSAEKQQRYGKVPKSQCCVKCHATDKLRRYHIFPQCYKKQFKDENKLCYAETIASNIVLLCHICYDKAMIIQQNYRNELTKKYNIVEWNKIIDCSNADIGIAGITLLRHFEQMNNNGMNNKRQKKKKLTILPQKRIDELLNTIMQHYQLESIDCVTHDVIVKASKYFISTRQESEMKRKTNVQHCKELIDCFDNDFEMLCKAWRDNFDKEMKLRNY